MAGPRSQCIPVAARLIACLLLVAASVAGQDAARATSLAFDEPRVFSLEPDDLATRLELGAARVVAVVPETDGPLTATVSSHEADVVLLQLDGEGTPIAADDDGGVEWNARLVIDAVAGEPVHLLAAFKAAASGQLSVLLRAGEVELPTGAELELERARFLRGRGEAQRTAGLTLDAAVTLNRAGELAFALGDLSTSLACFEQVLALADELGHAVLRTAAHARLGAIRVRFGELPAARELLERAVTDAGELNHAPLLMLGLSQLGEVLLELGVADESLAALERALEIALQLGDRANESALCSQLGRAAWLARDAAQARQWHDRAVSIAKDLGEAGVSVLTTALLSSGQLHEALGEFGEARNTFELALASATTSQVEAAILGHLANVARDTSDDLHALDLYRRVLATAREIGDARLEAGALISLGIVQHRLGDHVTARRWLEQALQLLGTTGAPALRAEALHTLAVVALDGNDPEAARAPIERALAMAREVGDGRFEAQVLASQVAWHYRRGEYAAAEEPTRQQLALGRELGAREVEAVALDNLAELRLRQDHLSEAGELSDQALAMARQFGDARILQAILRTRVEIVERRQDVEAVAAAVREAESCFARIDLSRLEPEQTSLLRAQDGFARWSEFSQDLVALTLATTSPDSDAGRQALVDGFRRAGEWKSRALLQGIAEHRRGGRDAATIELRGERRDLLAEREGLLVRIAESVRRGGSTEAELAALRARSRELGDSADSLLARLRDVAPDEAALDAPEGVGPEQLTELLGDGSVLLEFVEGREELYAYVLHDGELSFHALGKRAALQAEVGGFLAGMTQPDALASVEEVARRGRRLHAALLAPLLSGDVPADAPLVIVPSAELAALPFEALVAQAPERPRRFDQVTFVIDRREVCYAPSTPVLALLANVGPRHPGGRALILADPIYPSEDSYASARAALEGSGPVWSRLPGTREEALAVAQILLAAGATDNPAVPTADELSLRLEQSRSLTLDLPVVSLCLGDEATPGRLQGDLRTFAVIHCASHGWIDPDDPRRSGLVLSPDANGDDMLSMAEILELDLDAEIAVLSACETGRGAIRRREGVQSLARAFLYAGARSVVASLWQVDDRETLAVMQRFYAGYVGSGRAPAAALTAARRAVRRAPGGRDAFAAVGRGGRLGGSLATATDRIGHPFFWAPFVYVGLPRPAAGESVKPR